MAPRASGKLFWCKRKLGDGSTVARMPSTTGSNDSAGRSDSAARAPSPAAALAYRFLLMMLALLREATAVRRSTSWHPELPRSDGIAPNQDSSHKYFARVVS